MRPMAAMTSVRVVQTLSAGVDHVEPGLSRLPEGVVLCNALECTTPVPPNSPSP